ncbi:MAG: hypothetical protein H6684_08160 [Deltaproteobacteria bacterium]|nr:hypothetical protein [Deltaproteobacteria bacterium]MCB9488689.1 hypothetical protein [Deltaproteobacteria bacterium]
MNARRPHPKRLVLAALAASAFLAALAAACASAGDDDDDSSDEGVSDADDDDDSDADRDPGDYFDENPAPGDDDDDAADDDIGDDDDEEGAVNPVPAEQCDDYCVDANMDGLQDCLDWGENNPPTVTMLAELCLEDCLDGKLEQQAADCFAAYNGDCDELIACAPGPDS